MRSLRCLLISLILCVAALPRVFAQTNHTTNITLTNLLTSQGLASEAPAPYAIVCATPVDVYGNPVALSATGWGFITKGTNFCGSVVAGAISGGFNVPDASHTNAPAPIYYNISTQVTNSAGSPIGPATILIAVPNVSGATYSLDSYAPTGSTPYPLSNIVGYGSGVPSSCTSPSFWTDSTGVFYSCAGGAYVSERGGVGPAGPSGAGLTISTITGATTVTANANPLLFRCNGVLTLTLPASPAAGEIVYVKNIGSGTVTIAGNGMPIDGGSSYSLLSGIAIGLQPSITIAFDAATSTWSIL